MTSISWLPITAHVIFSPVMCVWPGNAIEREQLIPLDREKGLFTSNIHVLDELAVKALSQEVQRQNHVSVTSDASVVRQAPFSDAVSVLAQDRPVMGIVSGQGGATGQRERVAELTLMAREQGRDVHILAADNRSRDFLAGDVRLAGESNLYGYDFNAGMVS
ncbi:hypothetical protein MOQ79_27860 [Klebsiella pneumoniae]|nr:hypothetical protein [Klebsiella pneumoniae]UNS80741.1 hypothetical protein MOQ79_27860 [Klebsiella pneumoniae]